MERSSRYIPQPLRVEVATRANYRCEYCLQPENASFIKFQIDHIISLKHDGLTVTENLAYSCPICNSCKGSDVGTVLLEKDIFVRLFNPRKDSWAEHFKVSEGAIIPKSNVATATIKVLDLNNINRILERLDLIKAGVYP